MKKMFLKSFAALTLLVASSQLSVGQMFITHGPVGGVNFANLTGDDADGVGMRTSFHVGYNVDFNLNEKFAIGVGIQYSSKGAKLDIGGEDFPLVFNYLDYPIWLKYKLENGLFFQAGPYTALLMGVKLDGESDDPNGDSYKDSYKGTDFGVGFGLGYKLQNNLGFKADYNLGLSNISDQDGGDLKNVVLKFSVFYQFGGE